MEALQNEWLKHIMDELMLCDFTYFSTVFQSYQDDKRLKMNGCVQWKSVNGWKYIPFLKKKKKKKKGDHHSDLPINA